jgi:hypothetical protein
VNSKGREKLDHRVGPTGFKVNTKLLNLNKEDMLHEAKLSGKYSSVNLDPFAHFFTYVICDFPYLFGVRVWILLRQTCF